MSLKVKIKKIRNIFAAKYRILGITGVLLSLSGIYYFYPHANPSPSSRPKIVETEIVAPGTIEKTIQLIGTIRPKHATILVAKGSGTLDTLMSSGHYVTKGDLIAKIINPDIEKSYRLSQETEQLENTQYQRLKSLQKTGFVSAREVEEKKRIWIDSQKEKAKTKIELKNMRFYAPFDGIIGAFKVKEGAQVTEGSPVVTLYDPHSLTVEMDIPCTNTNRIENNQPVYLFQKRYNLSHVQKMIDDETHMCPADVDIQCSDCLVGASVTGQLVLQEKTGVLLIPAQALFLKQGKTHVYKVVDSKIELVSVETGLQQQDKIEITSGLHAGDLIVKKNPERLYPGLEVSIFEG